MRQYRYDEGRFLATILPGDTVVNDDLRFMEGARYDMRRQLWSLPANARVHRVLSRHGFEVLPRFAEPTAAFLRTLQRPVEDGPALTFGERVLLSHQNAGVAWLNKRTHALLHDEQGTGKTAHAIAWAHSDRKVIVTAANVLLPQWEAELKRMGVRWEPYYPSRIYGKEMYVAPKDGWMLINPEKLHLLTLPKGEYTLICDESSMYKNSKARRTKAALELAEGASKVLCLDGNAMINRPIELWTTYLMLRQRTRPEFWRWAERYTGSFKTPYGWDFSGATFIDELSEDLTGFALRREVKDILDLPEMLEQTITVPKNSVIYAELSVYAQILEKDIREGRSLRSGEGFLHLQNLRVESALSKIPFASDWLQDRVARGSKVVVFSEFKEPLRILGNDFNERMLGTYSVRVTGDESSDVRTENIRQFNENPECRVLLATYSVGERGLNLQVADTVLILDLPWAPSILAQAKARVRRYGQTKPTEAITLMSGHPIEEMMLNALMLKQDITDGLHSLERREFRL